MTVPILCFELFFRNESLDIDQIEAARKNSRIGKKIVLYKSTASTNDIAWEYAANADNDGLCILAESQHKGRGRRGRLWYAEPGQSILCSVLLTKTSAPAEMLTLTAGVAAAEALIDHCKVSCRIKWRKADPERGGCFRHRHGYQLSSNGRRVCRL
ncbi:MAG: biotin--[acetyl-CoA-carboxylase] ligase [Planctomycetota bacterium]